LGPANNHHKHVVALPYYEKWPSEALLWMIKEIKDNVDLLGWVTPAAKFPCPKTLLKGVAITTYVAV
jgi:hypothetical protein